MRGYLIRRLINTIIVLLGVVTLTFFLMHFTEGDPATIIALDKYGGQLISPKVIEQLASEEGLNRPIYVQFFNWLKLIGKCNFGNSLISGVPVWDEIMLRFPYTLELAIISVLISSLFGVSVGIYSAYYQDGWLDRITRLLASVKVSIPNFYLAIICVLIFSVKLKILPSFGCDGPRHFILPVLVLVISQIGFTIRIVRSTVPEILESEYVQYAYIRGLSTNRILFVHVLKNALIPVITYISLQFLMTVEGAIIVETIFAWPGIGKLFQEAILGRDFTMIQALVLFFAVLVCVLNFVVDILYLAIDRRINFL
ncbi:MAG: glutathione ABC transporter permease GsiC [Deltaproteobacteria bacterium]|nr:MAG: glutathione ABC transporter permease GsiC [Deltaproteobacteria bacterium]